jgi:hypothetical protein
MISLSRFQPSSLQAFLVRLPSRIPSASIGNVLDWYARIPQRVFWASLGVLAVVLSIPAMHAYSAMPFNLVHSTSETTGQETTAIEITQETLDSYTGPSISSKRDVHTQTDLLAFAATMMREDPSIKRITLGADSISMTYRSSVRLLHIGSRTIERTVSISKAGTVAITKPWYASFANERRQATDPEVGFADIAIATDSGGISIPTATKLLIRMHGRFQIGAI